MGLLNPPTSTAEQPGPNTQYCLLMTLSCAVSSSVPAELLASHVRVELSETKAEDMVRFPSPGPRV